MPVSNITRDTTLDRRNPRERRIKVMQWVKLKRCDSRRYMDNAGGPITQTMTHTSTIPFLSGRLEGPCRAVRSLRPMRRGTSTTTMEKQDFDAQYVSRLTEGDASVEQHFTAYFGEFLGIKLRRRGWAHHEIDDIRQETFLRVLQVLRQKKSLEHPERLGAFVNSVCNNIIFEFYKARARHPAFDPAATDPIDHTIDM